MIPFVHTRSRKGFVRYGGPVANASALASVPPGLRWDGMVCVVADSRQFWIFDADSTSQGDDIITPNVGSGRWLATTSLVLAKWTDVAPSKISVGSGQAAPTIQNWRDTEIQYEFARHDQRDIWSLSYQMPHLWAVGTDVRPHVHLNPTGSGSGNIVVSGYYAWTEIGQAQKLPALAGWSTFKVVRAITPELQYEEIPISMGSIVPPAWAGVSAHLHILWAIDGTDVDDNYTASSGFGLAAANRAVVSFDCHALLYPSGTSNEFS